MYIPPLKTESQAKKIMGIETWNILECVDFASISAYLSWLLI